MREDIREHFGRKGRPLTVANLVVAQHIAASTAQNEYARRWSGHTYQMKSFDAQWMWEAEQEARQVMNALRGTLKDRLFGVNAGGFAYRTGQGFDHCLHISTIPRFLQDEDVMGEFPGSNYHLIPTSCAGHLDDDVRLQMLNTIADGLVKYGFPTRRRTSGFVDLMPSIAPIRTYGSESIPSSRTRDRHLRRRV